MPNLPTNIDSTYNDDPGDPSVKAHQQAHDTIHGYVNTHDTAPDPHGDRAYADELVRSATDFVWIPATAMSPVTGMPTLAAFASRWPAWHFDPGVGEVVAATWDMPPGWTSVHFDLYWSHASSTATGAVRWVTQPDNAAPGSTLAATTSGGSETVTVGAQNALMVSRVGAAIPLTAGNLINLRVTRLATDATDTFASDAALLGVLVSGSVT